MNWRSAFCPVFTLLMIFGLCGLSAVAGENANTLVRNNVYYHPTPEEQADEYMREQCRLDLIAPTDNPGFATLVFYHGGGLSGGKRYIPRLLRDNKLKIAVVGVGYRLAPKVGSPSYIQDAAAGLAWVMKNIEEMGGDPQKVFVTGHSAGGYLAAMLALDPRWLEEQGCSANDLAGSAPLSAMVSTHFQIRKERGDEEKRLIIDEFAPLWHVRADAPPLLLVTGDREKDWPGRAEENLLLARMMKVVGHKDTTMYELQGWGHMMEEAGLPLVLDWLNRQLKDKEKAAAEVK